VAVEIASVQAPHELHLRTLQYDTDSIATYADAVAARETAQAFQVTDLLGSVCRLDLPDCLRDPGQNLLVLDALEVPLEAPPEGDVQEL
jgi:hypothetical protein